MRNDLTDITFIIDRSGSMMSCQSDAEGGLNSFIKNQQQQPGECLFTLIEFDHEYNFVHKGIPINEVPHYSLIPRGRTALLDAIGRAITEIGERLAKMPEDDRPGLVVVVIQTDGLENLSKEFKRSQIREMITLQSSKYNWQFTYLGANQDAFSEAGGLGISTNAAASYSVQNTSQVFDSLTSNVSRMRSAQRVGAKIENSYSDAERKRMS